MKRSGSDVPVVPRTRSVCVVCVELCVWREQERHEGGKDVSGSKNAVTNETLFT